MKNNKFILGVGVIALLLVAGVATASAYQGNYAQTGPNYSPDRHEAMEEAFAANDYNAWLDLMGGRGRVTQVINEDNFALFAEAHNLAEAGDTAGADAIRAELGLRTSSSGVTGQGNRGGRGQGMGQRGQNARTNFVDADNDGICDNMQ